MLGSNKCAGLLRRVPSAVFVEIAKLLNHRSDFRRRARTARPKPMRSGPAALWKMRRRKSNASGRVNGPYEFLYSRGLLENGTARIDGKEQLAAQAQAGTR